VDEAVLPVDGVVLLDVDEGLCVAPVADGSVDAGVGFAAADVGVDCCDADGLEPIVSDEGLLLAALAWSCPVPPLIELASSVMCRRTSISFCFAVSSVLSDESSDTSLSTAAASVPQFDAPFFALAPFDAGESDVAALDEPEVAVGPPLATSLSRLFRCVFNCASLDREPAGIDVAGTAASACFASFTWSAAVVALADVWPWVEVGVEVVCAGEVCDGEVCGVVWANPAAGKPISAAVAIAVVQRAVERFISGAS
jgi:hypothetical protein